MNSRYYLQRHTEGNLGTRAFAATSKPLVLKGTHSAGRVRLVDLGVIHDPYPLVQVVKEAG